ncbi:hypothetical protein CDL15_Pgr028899 [Punica granatum]|uniref:C2H2-type domain-containing protein n=1 Tax=Punica granatum TaxID=22663 RepID=A0A218WYW4_PUNGR|nr:hypothetical protein CDL15_Pgr028899 [Punica granatum]
MPGLTCNACNKEFNDDAEQKLHYKSEWHRYNLKRKVAGVPGVTETLFLARQAAIAQERNKSSETPMLYSCGICNKGCRSNKALDQHLNSRNHIARVSQGTGNQEEERTTVRPLPHRAVNKPVTRKQLANVESEESEDEWEEVGSDEELAGEATKSMSGLNEDEDHDMEEVSGEEDDDLFELDPSCCFMCDHKHNSIDRCMVHMHKQHGFFIPDVAYLKDPKGLLTYLGLKVKRDYMCLYCNDRCHPFSSVEAVRKHMAAKGHCKVHYGDGGEEEEAELEEFYDYSSSYMDEDGKQLVAVGDSGSNVQLGTAGSELIITRRTDAGVSTKSLGSREYMCYYRQKPRPSSVNDAALTIALASSYRSMGLATVQSREQMVRMKVMKEMNRSGVEAMRTKIGMKSNVIRNLPKNVPY